MLTELANKLVMIEIAKIGSDGMGSFRETVKKELMRYLPVDSENFRFMIMVYRINFATR